MKGKKKKKLNISILSDTKSVKKETVVDWLLKCPQFLTHYSSPLHYDQLLPSKGWTHFPTLDSGLALEFALANKKCQKSPCASSEFGFQEA